MDEELQAAAVVETEVQTEPAEPEVQPQDDKKYSDKDVDAIIAKKYAAWKSKQEAEANEAKKLAKMNAEEKAAHEKQKLEQRIAELEQEKTLRDMTSTARGMLSDAKIKASDELLALLVSTDADSTKTAVESFVALFNQHVESGVNDRLKGGAPIKRAPQESGITQDTFNRMGYRERLALKESNPALYAQLINK